MNNHLKSRIPLASGVSIFAVFVIACGGGGGPPPQSGNTRPIPSEEIQEKRSNEIDELIDRGIFQKIDAQFAPFVWVTPKFMEMNLNDKQSCIHLVAVYEFRIPPGEKLSPSESVQLVGSKSGQVIGTYDARGLHLAADAVE